MFTGAYYLWYYLYYLLKSFYECMRSTLSSSEKKTIPDASQGTLGLDVGLICMATWYKRRGIRVQMWASTCAGVKWTEQLGKGKSRNTFSL